MTHPAHALLASPAVFNPLSIAWHAAFWAEDPVWSNPGDGNTVSQWDDASGNSRHANQATAGKRPIYRASVAALGARPAVEFDTTDDFLATAAWTALVQANTIMAVGIFPGNVNTVGIDGITSTNRHFFGTETGTAKIRIFAGTSLVSSVDGDNAGHYFRARYNGATSTLHRDGTQVASGTTGTSPHTLTGITLGSAFDGVRPMGIKLAFLGVLDVDPTAEQIANFLAWTRRHYGTP